MIESNHDAALAKWLKDSEGALDPHNAYYWHDLNADWQRAIRDNVVDFNIVRQGMRKGDLLTTSSSWRREAAISWAMSNSAFTEISVSGDPVAHPASIVVSDRKRAAGTRIRRK